MQPQRSSFHISFLSKDDDNSHIMENSDPFKSNSLYLLDYSYEMKILICHKISQLQQKILHQNLILKYCEILVIP